MKERPILMSGSMVKATLENRKRQTRRVVKPQPDGIRPSVFVSGLEDLHGREIRAAYGKPGDRLWVRETYTINAFDQVLYKVDFTTRGEETSGMGWKSPYHMFRQYSRILLNLEAVRVERLQDISPSDCRAEGLRPESELSLLWRDDVRAKYRVLWDELNAKRGYGWDTNPWVWVLTFEQVKP